jgi:hypothetical protein
MIDKLIKIKALMASKNRRLTAQQATYQLPAVLVQPLTGRRTKKEP